MTATKMATGAAYEALLTSSDMWAWGMRANQSGDNHSKRTIIADTYSRVIVL
jgi:alpha-tubulin suppressor-like RCC1 family protein